MRDIKFRVFLKDTERYVSTNVDIADVSLVRNWRDYYILEQSTGLKDKNGKEIYEGDILYWENAPGMVSTNGFVFFNNDRGCWYIENEIDNIYDDLYNVYDYSEITGSIHE